MRKGFDFEKFSRGAREVRRGKETSFEKFSRGARDVRRKRFDFEKFSRGARPMTPCRRLGSPPGGPMPALRGIGEGSARDELLNSFRRLFVS